MARKKRIRRDKLVEQVAAAERERAEAKADSVPWWRRRRRRKARGELFDAVMAEQNAQRRVGKARRRKSTMKGIRGA